MQNKNNIIDGLKYVREVLNALPIKGVDNCRMIINAITNVDITIAEIQNLPEEKEPEQ